VDKRDLLPGQRWRVKIPKAIGASEHILIFLSKSSVAKRSYVQHEFKLALDVPREAATGPFMPFRPGSMTAQSLRSLRTCSGVTSTLGAISAISFDA
jgi:TIR domain